MYPNPQEALPLPPGLELQHYEEIADNLVKVCKSGEADGIFTWASDFVRGLVRRSRIEITRSLPVDIPRWADELTEFATKTLVVRNRTCLLTDAQFVIARSLGFKNWTGLLEQIEELSTGHSGTAAFEAAADAIVSGHIDLLRELIRKYPDLVRQRSKREHRATLLHYSAANGVEGYRQRTPQNIVAIAELLLRSGAEVDADADVYGGGCTTLGLASTSIHPDEAGVLEPLLELLLAHGAQMENPSLAITTSLANGRLGSALFFAKKGIRLDLDSAAGVGRLDLVQGFFGPDGLLLPSASRSQLQKGFLWACMHGWESVAHYLADHGADLRDGANTGGTGLHWAAGGAHAEIVRELIRRGSPLEEENQWGGTVLEHAGHGFEHSSTNVDFLPTFEAVLAAGAKIRGTWLTWIAQSKNRSETEKVSVSDLFRRYGATS